METTKRANPRERMLAALANQTGALALRLRRAVQRRAGVIQGAPADDPELPEPLRAYVDKVAKHAYKVTDEDLTGLQATYSTRQIYEITVAAAVGASLARREAALALLKGPTP